MALAFASSASAITYGQMWTGDPALNAPEMEQVQRSGASVFRMPIDKINLNLSATYDATFKSAWEHGITIEPILIRTNGSGQTQFPVAAEYGAWNIWVEQVVKRYGVGGEYWSGKANPRPVTNWEVWNEPNLAQNNPGGATVQPENYGRFLVSSSTAIRNVQPSATVLFGGLYMPGGMFYNSFLESAANAPGEPASYNAVGFHPYAFLGKVTEMGEGIESIRFALQNHVPGGAGKPLVINELGWPVAQGDKAHPQVSEVEQANLLTASFNWIKAHAAAMNIPTVYWYNLRDRPYAGWQYSSGLRKNNGDYRPSWWAYQAQTGAPEWPQVIGWKADNIGGNITSDPDISSWENGRLDVFARSSTGTLTHSFFTGGLWHPWESPIGGTLASGPGTVSWGPNRIDVVGRAANNSVEHWYWTGAGWGKDNLGGSIVGDPDISSWGNERLDVFARGADNSLQHKYFLAGVGWSGWESLGGTLTSGPGAVSWGLNRIDVVARGANNSAEHWAWTGAGWIHDNLAGTFTSDLDISSWGTNRLDVFGRGVDNALWHKYWGGTGWTEWERLGGNLASGPGAASWSVNRVDVVARTPSNTVEHFYYIGAK